ncbi:hypothetical protein [Cellulomonas fimi]|uniref:Adenylyl cyclase class-3/4/guanylyl cyclase n=1 Tax=Cellulomonas fimi (strain ATCC 484 / DSM 20113 / JCM 1341 / CCUG 24087 / LMG 16345 / NBRC 15513 / NCIMB 8980 / NCTC 7547 / NRS-133) TaxID=590998 RepID=F4GYH6_CELFA|nr:hypothetical protein [Cellulomonas fimi]AEE47093.1 adenylyl cyclase class-3/4/guanylyl cyclase [Cellulomonas fimi ATCC 484]NNH07336.1 adenylyl cyclase [Cellulomonas fimi]VEH35225.1 Uncharacterised protein [Cellulomonas fimi]
MNSKTRAHRMTLAIVGAAVIGCVAPVPSIAVADAAPDFGPNVKIFDPTTPVEEINAHLRSIANETEFGSSRHAVYFTPGTYGSAAGQDAPATATGIVNSEVGYYTSIAGLGASPDDVRLNGALHAEPSQTPDGVSDSLTVFYRSLSNLSINPIQRPVGPDADRERPEGIAEPHTLRWATSQASPLRRVHILGDLDLTGRYGANAFGTEIADSRVDGWVVSGDGAVEKAQAQYYVRDSQIGGWDGDGANLVFSGVHGAPRTNFGTGGITALDSTPISRPAPFLTMNQGRYEVFVPAARRQSSGVRWSTDSITGSRVPISEFHIAKPGADTVATINAALRAGKHLILTPGVYRLDGPIEVTRASTVVLGMGYATLAPAGGRSAIEVGDVPGVVISGVMVDASPGSDVLVKIGSGKTPHSGSVTNPTTLSDLFVRVGGARNGSTKRMVEVNQNGVLLDGNWLWRADHGTGVGWASNTADHGLVVNADDVTALGLYVEHAQRNQVVWNGERGVTVFYQSEMPYDPPNQAAWMDGTRDGFASYSVGSHVKTHQATGLAIYTLFTDSTFARQPVHADRAIQAPRISNVRFRSMVTAVIYFGGGIRHVVNDMGPAVDATAPNSVIFGMTAAARLAAYPVA